MKASIIVAVLAVWFSGEALAGRTIYIPPVFSNKDFECPVGTDQKIMDFCWDFSLTNLSTVSQTVHLTAKAGTVVQAFAGTTLPSDIAISPALSFSGTQGQSLQAAFCVSCSSSGCNKGWTTTLAGLGSVGQAAAGVAASTFTPPGAGAPTNTWMFYHAEGVFQVDIDEDRGAIVGRLNQRIFPSPATQDVQCRDTWTSPQVVVELNGGRPF